MPGLIKMVGATPPPGKITLRLAGDETFTIGEGNQVAVVAGTPIEVLTLLWNRGGTAETSGGTDLIDWWTNLPGQLTGATRD